MSVTLQYIADLERINYTATFPITQVTPGLELILRDDVILTSSQAFPSPDTTHACLLRASPPTIDALIAEVIDYFRSKAQPVTIFVSPACTPADLAEHLARQGFVRQAAEEAWLALDDLLNLKTPAAFPAIAVKQIAPNEAETFSKLFMTAFDMPLEFAPYMAQLLEPSIGLPGVYHYLARLGDQPIGTCSLICHQRFGIMGSAGVVPEHRKSGAATNLVIEAIAEAQRQGVDTLLLQTTAGAPLERLLRISGFKKLFTRIGYTLP